MEDAATMRLALRKLRKTKTETEEEQEIAAAMTRAMTLASLKQSASRLKDLDRSWMWTKGPPPMQPGHAFGDARGAGARRNR